MRDPIPSLGSLQRLSRVPTRQARPHPVFTMTTLNLWSRLKQLEAEEEGEGLAFSGTARCIWKQKRLK